jgi:hypothetical protein
LAAPLRDLDVSLLPRNAGWMVAMAYFVDIAERLADPSLAGRAYAQLVPYAGETVVTGAAVACLGTVDHYLGRLAAVEGRPAEARAHLSRAAEQYAALGAPARAEAVRAALAAASPPAAHSGPPAVPLSRSPAAGAGPPAGPASGGGGSPADSSGSPSAPAGVPAGPSYAGVGSGSAGSAGREPARPVDGVFRRDGGRWTVGLGGTTARLRHAKGLADLAVLLAAPGRPVPAVDLAAAAAGEQVRTALRFGSDPVLDARARRELRARLRDLAGPERDAVLAGLKAATGLGGHGRRLGDPAERARKAVTARIRDAIGRVAAVDPALGSHLDDAVTTGTYCTYSPASPVRWRF